MKKVKKKKAATRRLTKAPPLPLEEVKERLSEATSKLHYIYAEFSRILVDVEGRGIDAIE